MQVYDRVTTNHIACAYIYIYIYIYIRVAYLLFDSSEVGRSSSQLEAVEQATGKMHEQHEACTAMYTNIISFYRDAIQIVGLAFSFDIKSSSIINNNNNKNDYFYIAVTWRKVITRALSVIITLTTSFFSIPEG